MDRKPPGSTKRHKKKESRTFVTSPSSESDAEIIPKIIDYASEKLDLQSLPTISKQQPEVEADSDVSIAFNKYYMQRITVEFAEDLDCIRGADDFKDKTLPILVNALQQGTSIFSFEEQQRVVMAGNR